MEKKMIGLIGGLGLLTLIATNKKKASTTAATPKLPTPNKRTVGSGNGSYAGGSSSGGSGSGNGSGDGVTYLDSVPAWLQMWDLTRDTTQQNATSMWLKATGLIQVRMTSTNGATPTGTGYSMGAWMNVEAASTLEYSIAPYTAIKRLNNLPSDTYTFEIRQVTAPTVVYRVTKAVGASVNHDSLLPTQTGNNGNNGGGTTETITYLNSVPEWVLKWDLTRDTSQNNATTMWMQTVGAVQVRMSSTANNAATGEGWGFNVWMNVELASSLSYPITPYTALKRLNGLPSDTITFEIRQTSAPTVAFKVTKGVGASTNGHMDLIPAGTIDNPTPPTGGTNDDDFQPGTTETTASGQDMDSVPFTTGALAIP